MAIQYQEMLLAINRDRVQIIHLAASVDFITLLCGVFVWPFSFYSYLWYSIEINLRAISRWYKNVCKFQINGAVFITNLAPFSGGQTVMYIYVWTEKIDYVTWGGGRGTKGQLRSAYNAYIMVWADGSFLNGKLSETKYHALTAN